MAVHALMAAKKVCEVRNWDVSNLEINKILYLAHMMSLGRSNGANPLVSENFEAWDYGPVLPSVYHRCKAFGSGRVQNVFQYVPDASAADAAVIQETADSLKGKSPGELVAITHWQNGAWACAYKPGYRGIIIPNENILQEYRVRVG
jgi:uncharacterized phage-associated protein